MFTEIIRIPKERVAVLIGQKGSFKRELQIKLNVSIKIDSNEGIVEISSEDGLNNYLCKNIIQVIGRGLTPDEALVLLDDNYTAEVISIKDFTGSSKKKQDRVKSRLIGEEGRVRKKKAMYCLLLQSLAITCLFFIKMYINNPNSKQRSYRLMAFEIEINNTK